MTRTAQHFARVLIVTSIALTACKNDPTSPAYDPVLPNAWVGAVTNAFLPLTPGLTYRYQGQTSEGVETVVVEILSEKKMINGVSATVVRDRVYLAGNLIEDTYDWFAQDGAGNVWYLGEDSKEIENGRVVSNEGSWQWGVKGALPGIIMWANPATHVGESYRQEYARGEAEDWGKVVAVNETVQVPFGRFTGCIKTEDWNGLEGSGSLEHKYYCPQIGVTLEVSVRGNERVELMSSTEHNDDRRANGKHRQ